MKYSIIGSLNGILPDTPEEQNVIDVINVYNPIWRLNPNTVQDDAGNNVMLFEIWLETETDKNSCFLDVKSFVDMHTGKSTWHVCTHDEPSPKPCVISEEYRR